VTDRIAAFLLVVTLSVLTAAPASSRPATPSGAAVDPKRIYIANDDHTDYFWTGTADQYKTAFQTMLDYYMAQAEATASNPPDSRGRFNCDGSLWAWVYEHNRSPEDFERLMSHVRDGTISLPLQTCVMLYGAMPAEAVLRNMYYAGRLERRENLRFPLVVAMENQTLPGGVASLWAGAGAKYSWKGICNCATQIQAGTRSREMYRFLGPDGNGVWMKWNSQPPTSHLGAYWIGGYAEARSTTDVVNYLDDDAGFAARWPWPVSAAFGFGGDDLQTTTNAFITASQSLSDASRRVIVSNEQDFFEDFLPLYQDQLPTFSGSFGNEWDLYTASMSAVTAEFKRQVEKLRTAEALATVASLQNADFMSGRETMRDSAFLACGLFYEHDWTADGPVPRSSRAKFQRDMLWTLQRYVDDLQGDALAAVGASIRKPAGVERHFVFNPLSWERTDYADLPVTMPAPYHVVDLATGEEVPSETVTVSGVPGRASSPSRCLRSATRCTRYGRAWARRSRRRPWWHCRPSATTSIASPSARAGTSPAWSTTRTTISSTST
jgi:alpha-mannosidase